MKMNGMKIIIVAGLCLVSASVAAQTDATGYENGHGYVDLGLSVKWSTCNVGAKTPGEYGSYFAWAENSTKREYTCATLKYCPAPEGEYLTKYNTDANYGPVDDIVQLEPSDDAARANWGEMWRIPTVDEWKELMVECNWRWQTMKGVNGYMVISKKNGNAIFIPAAGNRYESSSYNIGNIGYYWSSSLTKEYPGYAWFVFFDMANVRRYCDYRYYGLTIRPVLRIQQSTVE